MPASAHPYAASVAGTLLATALIQCQPPLHTLGAVVAANATEFRWNLPLLALVGLAQLAPVSAPQALRNALRSGGLALAFCVATGFAEYAAALSSEESGGLWGAPLHLFLAGVMPAWLCLSASHRASARGYVPPQPALILGAGAVSLGGLGLLWNFAQTSLQEGWAWDWIESGPCWALLSLVGATHLWAFSGASFFVPYLAFLSLSRTALITSAHHLQSPSNLSALDPDAGMSAAVVWANPGSGGAGPFLLGLLALVGLGRAAPWGPARPGRVRPPASRGDLLAPALLPWNPAAGLSSVFGRIAPLAPGLGALHWSFVLLFTAGLRLLWWGGGGLGPSPEPAAPLGAGLASHRFLAAPLLGAGWLHLSAAPRLRRPR